MRKISAIARHFRKSLNQCYLRKLSPMKKKLIENNEIINTEKGTAKVSSTFFSNIV